MKLSREDALKAIWGYLAQHGSPTNGRASYYGGWEYPDDFKLEYGQSVYKQSESYMKKVVSELKHHDFCWSPVPIPEYINVAEFTGTFSEPEQVECIVGEVVIKGKTFKVGVKNAPSWAIDLLEALRVKNAPIPGPIVESLSFWKN